ncbi:hypothetical protein [Gluconobacter aidae]|uniref:Uncharacterized protein n=1 Tax=Gluconobacter aidae TaxID=2662454 RepID=A0A7X1VQ99_9PROT|nr:hypothetical protein [Gluconobacter aidae]MQR99310.1 hypothetical protein [Gluconobacter aidae]
MTTYTDAYADNCIIHTLGPVNMLGSGVPIIIEAKLNNKEVGFIINTTLPKSVIYRNYENDRDVHVEHATDSIFGLGGFSNEKKIWAWKLRIGTAEVEKAQFEEADEKDESIGPVPIVGEIGNDILSLYDLDINIPKKIISFYQTEGCGSAPPMWKGKIWAVPTSYRTPPLSGRLVSSVEDNIIQSGYNGNKIKIEMKIGGIKSTGVLDTSSANTSVSDKYKPNQYNVFRSYKYYKNGIVTSGRNKFIADLSIGPLEMLGETIYLDNSYDHENVIGADFLKYMEVWIPAEGGEIYITNIVSK